MQYNIIFKCVGLHLFENKLVTLQDYGNLIVTSYVTVLPNDV